MVVQYTTQFLLPLVAKLIDDIYYENNHVPALKYQQRVRHHVENERREAGHLYVETDYVDAQIHRDYIEPKFQFVDLQVPKEVKRLELINTLFKNALRGKSIGIAALRRTLTHDEMREFNVSSNQTIDEGEWQYGSGMPTELQSYTRKLHQADLMWARYEMTSSKNKNAGALECRAERLYEIALEALEEIFDCAARGEWGMQKNADLHAWMDRPIDFDAGFDRTLGVDVHRMPRVRGSKSRYAHDSGLPKLSKRLKQQYLALRSLLVVACEIAFIFPALPQQEDDPQMQLKLQEMMAKLKASR